jgi:hypothetical protein
VDGDEINVNKNDITLIEDDSVNIRDINVDSFIEGHRLALMSARVENVVKMDIEGEYISKKKKLKLYIKYLEEISKPKEVEEEEEGEDSNVNYRDKDREQRQKDDVKKLKSQVDLQNAKKKLINRILMLLKKRKDLWGVITSERNLNREIGGHAIDYALEAKIKYFKGLKKKKLMMQEWYRSKTIGNMTRAMDKMFLAKKALKRLSKLLGRKVAVKLLRVLIRGNKLNTKNLNKIIKKVVAMKKGLKVQVGKIKKKSKSLEEAKAKAKEMKKFAEAKAKEMTKTKEVEKLEEKRKEKAQGMSMGM